MDRQLVTDAPPAKPTLLERGTKLVRVEAVLDRGCLGTGGLMVIEGPAVADASGHLGNRGRRQRH
jgi:hypothetical protein